MELERIVAGLQAATASDADVVWNEEINGRQFDVAVRFQHGTLRFLVLIEVKNRTRKATASDLEAFVQKSRDQNANKAVFVTAAGFQQGAIEVAKRHAVDLFTVTFDEAQPILPANASTLVLSQTGAPPVMTPAFEFGEPELIANVESIDLIYTDGSRASLPSERSQMSYYAARTRFADGSSLKELIDTRPINKIAEGQYVKKTVRLRPSRKIAPPDEYFFPAGKVRAVEWAIVGRIGRSMQGNALVDPGMFTSPVVYSNVITGETFRFQINQLPLNFEDIRVGEFYQLEHPLRYYYCEGISDEIVRWLLVESFQIDQFVQIAFTQKIEYGRHMIPVRHGPTLARLRRRLSDLQKQMALEQNRERQADAGA
jgi:hypothetical protein